MIIKPRVVIITPGSFPIPSPNSSSVETVVDRLTNALKTTVEFTILGKKSKDLPFIEKKENIIYRRFTYRKWTGYLKKAVAILSKLNPHIIQIENRPKYISIIRKAFPETQIWLSIHSTFFISKSRISKDELINSLHSTNKIIVNSQFLKNYLVKKTSCDESKIFVNNLGVDTSQFRSKWGSAQSDRKTIKNKMDLDGKRILLFVGRLRKIKGVDRILKAMPAIIKNDPNTILIIVGSAFYGSDKKTDYVEYLYQLAAGISHHVRMIPFIPHDEIHSWFEAADIVLVPSIGKEAFGLVNVEAMACGVPVIATNVGGLPEVIEHGKTGFLLNVKDIEKELGEYVIRMLSSPQILKQMGKKSVEHVQENFTWEKCAKRLLTLYRQEVKENNGFLN